MRRIIKITVWLCVCAVVLGAVGARTAAVLRETQTAAQVAPSEGRFVDTAQGRIFVLEQGPADGVPVLLAHGTGAWAGLWQPVLEALAEKGYRAIAFDLPPFGFSDRDPGGDYHITTQAARIAGLTRALEVRPVMVAHSFGAAPAMEAVLTDPAQYQAVVLVAAALGIGSHLAPKEVPLVLRPDWLRTIVVSATATNPLLTGTLLRQLIHVKSTATAEVVTVLQRPMTRSGSTAAFAAWLPYLLRTPTDARSTRAAAYQALDLPTGLIWGTEDTVTPLDQGQELQALLPDAGLITLADTGHIPQLERPEMFIAALLQALEAVVPR